LHYKADKKRTGLLEIARYVRMAAFPSRRLSVGWLPKSDQPLHVPQPIDGVIMATVGGVYLVRFGADR